MLVSLPEFQIHLCSHEDLVDQWGQGSHLCQVFQEDLLVQGDPKQSKNSNIIGTVHVLRNNDAHNHSLDITIMMI